MYHPWRYAAPVTLPSVRPLAAGCAVALALVLVAFAPAAGAAPAASGHGLKKVHDPGRVTGTIHGHCTYRDHGQLPDPRCTPGSVDPDVTQANIGSTICKSGWTKTVRPPEAQTERFKYDVAVQSEPPEGLAAFLVK